MLRAASIGLGSWSHELARAIAGKSGKIDIASCFSRSEERRRKFAAEFGTGMHASMETLLGDNGIDAVLITSPHSLHAGHVLAAAAAGKHVFVEKPFTLTAESGREAWSACERAGVRLAVGHNRRFAAVSAELLRMAQAGDLGRILHIEANFSAPSALNWTEASWRASREESPAGGLAGLGVHMIDLIAALGGPVVRVMAQAKRQVLKLDVDDTTSTLLDLSSGATAYLGTLTAAPFATVLNVYGTNANAFAHVDAGELRVQKAGGLLESRAVGHVDTLRAELEEFADACAGQAIYRVKPEEAIHVVAVMEAIAASANSCGRAIDVDG